MIVLMAKRDVPARVNFAARDMFDLIRLSISPLIYATSSQADRSINSSW
jgi:hypothetical protein